MIYVDVKRPKTIEFDIENVDLVESVQLVVLMSDKNNLTFSGSIINVTKDNTGTLLIDIPVLNDIPVGTLADCYIEIKGKNNTFYKTPDKMLFQTERIMSLQFHEVNKKPEAQLRGKTK